MDPLNQNLKAASKEATKTNICAYAPPAITFQSLWQFLNRLEKKKFELLPQEVRATVHGSSGQGRVECLTVDSMGKITNAYYYHGGLMYSALTRGMPVKGELPEQQKIFAAKVALQSVI